MNNQDLKKHNKAHLLTKVKQFNNVDIDFFSNGSYNFFMPLLRSSLWGYAGLIGKKSC